MEQRLNEKVKSIKCIHKKKKERAQVNRSCRVGVTLWKKEVDVSVRAGLIPIFHLLLLKQGQNRESTCVGHMHGTL